MTYSIQESVQFVMQIMFLDRIKKKKGANTLMAVTWLAPQFSESGWSVGGDDKYIPLMHKCDF